MVRLTRLNHVPVILNADLIEHIEATPDTVITLVNQQKIRVLETADEVVARVIAYRRQLAGAALVPIPAEGLEGCSGGGAKPDEQAGDGA